MAREFNVYEYWQNKSGKWNYRLRAKNGKVQSFTNQGFNSEADVIRGIKDDQRNSATAKIMRVAK